MSANLGDPMMVNELNALSMKLTQAIKLMGKFGREYAAAERDYKVALAKNVISAAGNGTFCVCVQDTYRVCNYFFRYVFLSLMILTTVHVNTEPTITYNKANTNNGKFFTGAFYNAWLANCRNSIIKRSPVI